MPSHALSASRCPGRILTCPSRCAFADQRLPAAFALLSKGDGDPSAPPGVGMLGRGGSDLGHQRRRALDLKGATYGWAENVAFALHLPSASWCASMSSDDAGTVMLTSRVDLAPRR